MSNMLGPLMVCLISALDWSLIGISHVILLKEQESLPQ